MKVLGITIGRVQEKFKGFFDLGTNPRKTKTPFYLGQHSWRERCRKFDLLAERHPLAKQALLTIAGQVIAEGLYLQPVTDVDGKPYPRSEQAQQTVEDFNKQVAIETLLYDTAYNMAKFGSCFWEVTWTPRFDVRVIPMQETIEPKAQDEAGNITEWRQVQNGRVVASWTMDELVHFCWNQTSQSWPYGTSLLVGLDEEFATLEQLEDNIKDFMEKQAWPYEVLQLGNETYQPTEDQVSSVKSKWKNRNIGENLITTYPSAIVQGGTGSSPIRELSDILDFLKNNVEDGVMVPSISKLYNSTEASSTVMSAWTASCLIKPMQRIIRQRLENEIYQPLLEDGGFSVKTCPTVLFESPDSHKAEDGEFWVKMVQSKIATPQQAAEELGIEYDEAYWSEMERKEQEQFQQKLTAQKEKADSEAPKGAEGSVKVNGKLGEGYLVRKVTVDA